MSEEKFSFKKFIGGFNILNPVTCAKVARDSFYTLLTLAVIIGLIYGIGYLKGLKSKPVTLNAENATIKVENGDGKEHIIEFKNKEIFYDGKKVSVGQMINNKPYGFKLHPGIGYVETRASFFLTVAYLRQLEVDLIVNQAEFGAGLSYKIDLEKPLVIKNTSIGAGYIYRIQQEDKIIKLYVKISL